MLSGKSDSRCRICGKLLTDPVSVERGIGPECAGKYKRSEHADKTGNLFAHRAEYSWGVDGHILWIQDEEGAKSVTNDIEFVMGDIFDAIGQQLFNKLIMYRDSMHIWDGVRLANRDCYVGITAGNERSSRVDIDDFFSIHETDYKAAKLKLLSMCNNTATLAKVTLTPADFFK
ncbi:DUF6011 domain-containing protein [Spirosoma areae]